MSLNRETLVLERRPKRFPRDELICKISTIEILESKIAKAQADEKVRIKEERLQKEREKKLQDQRNKI